MWKRIRDNRNLWGRVGWRRSISNPFRVRHAVSLVMVHHDSNSLEFWAYESWSYGYSFL